MRPQQQNRRMRGRGGNNNNNSNNNNRKGPNPLTRSYESNGPDVKIRGSAQQIADKYTTLARDAQSSGDRVMAENYLQHAEHYNRIIAAALAQMPQPQQRESRDEDFDEEDRDEDNAGQQRQQPQQPVNGHGPQPVIEGVPAEVAYREGEIRAEAPRAEGGNEAGNASEPAAEAVEGEAKEAAPRRARRPRRPRKDAQAENAGDEPAADEPVPAPTSDAA